MPQIKLNFSNSRNKPGLRWPKQALEGYKKFFKIKNLNIPEIPLFLHFLKKEGSGIPGFFF